MQRCQRVIGLGPGPWCRLPATGGAVCHGHILRPWGLLAGPRGPPAALLSLATGTVSVLGQRTGSKTGDPRWKCPTPAAEPMNQVGLWGRAESGLWQRASASSPIHDRLLFLLLLGAQPPCGGEDWFSLLGLDGDNRA